MSANLILLLIPWKIPALIATATSLFALITQNQITSVSYGAWTTLRAMLVRYGAMQPDGDKETNAYVVAAVDWIISLLDVPTAAKKDDTAAGTPTSASSSNGTKSPLSLP
ncbi:unnamed protein product [Vitrella brassicaformis CCMP3155]|uniref:Uncharacterized protein n=1 Tax=Vitrella brassicaformis (strain CCMP3155) TaxID=1169540 RepID=A0A0G4FSP2_VITBC|nr:unnamed protein product [Vitrella brassicaformis CCMP3155]|mmetsp:Transcript_28679/g.82746  ORF Transcript_28679/g.82746 Transcript_28679/m.82746 type:complete len:110 (-) Transcript_28679:232-561(-)|eukprot:CEM17733.1 unnamed protein product [Vitrella brassicaformis CCMP3155]